MSTLQKFRRRFHSRRVAWLPVSLILIAIAVTASAQPTPFVHEFVDGGDPAGGASFDFDGDWDPHVVWMVPLGGGFWDVMYAEQSAPDNWMVQIVATVNITAAGDDTRPRIAVEEDGTPNIVFVDGFIPAQRQVIYATLVGGVWVTTPVDVVGFTGGNVSIDVDPAGFAHVAYWNSNTSDLWYASEFSGWIPELVDPAAPVGQFTSVVCDDPFSDLAQVAYYNQGITDLWYALRLPGGVWAPVSVDATGVTGLWCSLALDPQGNPHISYLDATGGLGASVLKYATPNDLGGWDLEFADLSPTSVGFFSSIDVDQNGVPHIGYSTLPGDLKYATRAGGLWGSETVAGNMGTGCTLKIGIHGNAAVTHVTPNSRVLYTDAGLHLMEPVAADNWPVGADRDIRWRGAGPVNLELSVDGGNTFDQVATGLFAGPDGSNGVHTMVVPNTPSRFCLVKVEREDPFSESITDSFFTIEVDVALLNFVVNIGDLAGNTLRWQTDPGPEDLAGYRIDRASPDGPWETIEPLTTETEYTDAFGQASDRYRLYAINGLGQEFLIGESSGDAPKIDPHRVAAWPQPFSDGELSIGFGTFGALGATSAHVTIDVYDVKGRHVKRVADDTFSAGTHVVKWDGLDADGVKAASGVYFIVSKSGEVRSSRKIVIVR